MLQFCVLATLAVPQQPASYSVYTVVHPSPVERLASREVRRYLYLRTGVLVPILEVDRLPKNARGVVVATASRPLVARTGVAVGGRSPDAYRLATVQSGRLDVLAGATDAATLYAAYALAEKLGVRFYLHGDTVPDVRIRLEVPKLDVKASPLFRLRGIQPFHDFAEGPDWWNREDYLAIVDQLPKLRMNFIGLHTYPEPIAEPTVWIGLPEDIKPFGDVSFGYRASYQNTLRGDWGYGAKETSKYGPGLKDLFERDDFSNDVMRGLCPKPDKPGDFEEVFNRQGRVLNDAFREAHSLGVKTCVGTETPLTIPQRVKERNPSATRKELYEGIFRRIITTHPLDYYWMWTPEGWTWSGNSDADVKNTLDDIGAAIAAAKSVNAKFKLATCGWVLGPQNDRALFDKHLPKEVAVSCINRSVGAEPVDPGFADVHGRDKWAIPWMEDDPALTAPQLWAGRMRRDAQDAYRYGCTGLMGIHWRTRILGPNVSALARAAWDQKGWPSPAKAPFSAVGGSIASYGEPIAGTSEPAVYHTVRYNLQGYKIKLPNGTYDVTLRFSELAYDRQGKRVFDVSLNGSRFIEALDIFAKVGKDKALDYTFKGLNVRDGVLKVGFTPRVEFPCIAAIVVRGLRTTVKINCGGPAVDGYLSDLPSDLPRPGIGDFYLDWARAEFGPEIAEDAAKIFTKIDGRLPRPLEWLNGPGGLAPDSRAWAAVAPEYSFVASLEGLGSRVTGAGGKARFAYWLHEFEYMREVAKLRCDWGALEAALTAKAADRIKECVAGTMTALAHIRALLLSTVSTTGEMGTVSNWEQHDVDGPEGAVARGEAVVGSVAGVPEPEFATQIIVPTARTHVEPGTLRLKVILIGADGGVLKWRPLGRGAFRSVPLTHVARGVFTVGIPANEDFEYYIVAGTTVWPATAPSLNQSVVVVRL